MTTYGLTFTLKSDATFGSGSGLPGFIDREVVVDSYGCPYLHGRTLKGLLNEVCANILYALGNQSGPWLAAADGLFGRPGSTSDTQGVMAVGHAQLPADLRSLIRRELQKTGANAWSRSDITASLTTVREQTAMNPDGSPEDNSLRVDQVILRETPFGSQFSCARALTDREKGLLAACVMGWRRAGTARNRGRGRLEAHLISDDKDIAEQWYLDYFKQEVMAP
ncbi:MAG: hypothetical protein GXP38_05080 [Chloroflexi bacterium]|nr:hypothetical protein [Chloroflexota bacterium]